ncbi:unnamed protein product [Paramecium sonneborni]|uniref:Transmembrane protein n=1 Tax=Paramecium sonneborni TaxID=65129 RepID=A0A8S1N5Z3_9CILI|nr:unnamed protein product [Paramecium sonneborni]
MNGFLNVFTKLDGFFISFSPSFGLTEQKIFYKSVWGGMATIIILTFVFVYSINQFIIWESGDMIYKVSTQQKFISEGSYLEQAFLKSDPHQFVDIEFDSSINPFDSNQMIIIPLLYIYNEETIYQLDYSEDGQFRTLNVDLNNLLDNAFTIVLVKCIGNEQYISETQKCASQQQSEEFFNQSSLLPIITIYNEEFDYQTKTYYQLETYIELPLDPILTSEIQIYTKYEIMEINYGYLFQSSEEYIINNGCTSQIYTYTKDYYNKFSQKIFGIQEVIGVVRLEMDSSIFYVRNQYPTISEVLANIGSIIQTILLSRYFFYAFNRNQLKSYMKSLILTNYYPEWKDINKIKNNQKKTCVLDDRNINNTSVQKFEKEVNEMLNLKFDFINLIYEINQMQKILQLISPPDILLNIHSNQSKLQFLADQDSNNFSIKNTWSSFKDYTDAIYQNHLDPFLFSFHWKTKNKNSSFYKMSSGENKQIQKQYEPTQKQDNEIQVDNELKFQDIKICTENNDQLSIIEQQNQK